MTTRPRHARRRTTYLPVLVVSFACGVAACAPRVAPLTGVEAAGTFLPASAMQDTPHQLRVSWHYRDDTFEARGEGVVRVAPPNRARLDLFLANGFGGGMALLEDDSLFVPGLDVIGRFLPPPTLLWGALGRLTLPTIADTVLRLDGDTVRADLTEASAGSARGRPRAPRVWRAHFVGRELARLERIEQRRAVEWMTRSRDSAGVWQLRYVHATGRRSLSLTVLDLLTIPTGFDAAIWRRP